MTWPGELKRAIEDAAQDDIAYDEIPAIHVIGALEDGANEIIIPLSVAREIVAMAERLEQKSVAQDTMDRILDLREATHE